MSLSLLPRNSELAETAIAEAIEFPPAVGEAIDDIHGVKYARLLNVTVAPYLVQEYGLGPISQFFDTYEALIDEGRIWQRLRGTPEALSTSLEWVGYNDIEIEDQNANRRRWHLYQIGMGEIPLAEEEVERLTDAEYLAGISDPARSEFFRGYHGYDVRSLGWSNKRWGRALFGDSSGVRLAGGGTKWSHGRLHEVSSHAGIIDWADLNMDFVNGQPVVWTDDISWEAPGVTWEGIADAGHLKAWVMLRKRATIAFTRGDDSIIGYSLVVVRPQDATPEDADYDEEFYLRYEVQTGFGDGAGEECSYLAVAYNGVPADGVKPFKRWLTPDEMTFPSSAVIVGKTAFARKLMNTVRERIVFTLGF